MLSESHLLPQTRLQRMLANHSATEYFCTIFIQQIFCADVDVSLGNTVVKGQS